MIGLFAINNGLLPKFGGFIFESPRDKDVDVFFDGELRRFRFSLVEIQRITTFLKKEINP